MSEIGWRMDRKKTRGQKLELSGKPEPGKRPLERTGSEMVTMGLGLWGWVSHTSGEKNFQKNLILPVATENTSKVKMII